MSLCDTWRIDSALILRGDSIRGDITQLVHLRTGVPRKRSEMALLSYDIEHPTLRPPVEEWQPHATQTAKSTEWWYLTSLAFDTAGNPYFLVWCLFHFGGEDTHNASIQVPEGHRLNLGMLGITDYRADHHFDGVSFAVMKD